MQLDEKRPMKYKKLCRHSDGYGASFSDGNFAFEDDTELADRTGEPTSTGITPPYVLALLKRYPDALDGFYGPQEKDISYFEEGNMPGKQRLLLMIADKIACETRVVLLIRIEGSGEVMPQRLRIKADDVSVFHATWANPGHGLEENFREGEAGALNYYDGDDSWSPS